MVWIVVSVVILVLILALLELKTGRPDGDLIKVHAYRRALSFVEIRRNESVVYYDTYVDATKVLAYLDEVNQHFEVRLTHVLVAALNLGIHGEPRMNRFLVGRRMYQRRGRWLSFSVKKVKQDHKAKLAALKLEMHDEESFRDLAERINAFVHRERSGQKTSQDKEMDLLSSLPRPIFAIAVQIAFALDYYNLLPGWFIKGDGMYTSIFLANLGSVGMPAGYHHLYEWGNAPIFVVVGELEDRPMVVDGEVVVRPTLHLRWSYDERIDDGMSAWRGISGVVNVLEHPHERLGCLAEDGSDTFPMVERGQQEEVGA